MLTHTGRVSFVNLRISIVFAAGREGVQAEEIIMLTNRNLLNKLISGTLSSPVSKINKIYALMRLQELSFLILFRILWSENQTYVHLLWKE